MRSSCFGCSRRERYLGGWKRCRQRTPGHPPMLAEATQLQLALVVRPQALRAPRGSRLQAPASHGRARLPRAAALARISTRPLCEIQA